MVATKLYSIGKSLCLIDAVAHGQPTVVIVQVLRVGKIRSQTVIVRDSNSSRDDKSTREYLAKFFDSSYYTLDIGEFDGSATEFMKAQLTNEVRADENVAGNISARICWPL